VSWRWRLVARSSTTRLLTDKEVDAAIGKTVAYRLPGKGKVPK